MISFLLFASVLAGSTAQRVNADLRNVVGAVLELIDPDPDVRILIGDRLGSRARDALRELMPRAQALPSATETFVVPENAVVVEAVTISGSKAIVRLTYGPVPVAVWREPFGVGCDGVECRLRVSASCDI